MSDETSKPKRVAFVTRDASSVRSTRRTLRICRTARVFFPPRRQRSARKTSHSRPPRLAGRALRQDARRGEGARRHRYSGKRRHARSRPHLRRWRSSGHGPSGVLERRHRGPHGRARTGGHPARHRCDARKRRRRQVRATGRRPEGRQPYAHGVGNVVGTGTGLVAGAGGAAEQLATKGLARAGVQATSALGKAGVAAAKLGVRGAVEGGIIGGGEYAGEQPPGPRRSRGQSSSRRSGRALRRWSWRRPRRWSLTRGERHQRDRWRSLVLGRVARLREGRGARRCTFGGSLVDDLGRRRHQE